MVSCIAKKDPCVTKFASVNVFFGYSVLRCVDVINRNCYIYVLVYMNIVTICVSTGMSHMIHIHYIFMYFDKEYLPECLTLTCSCYVFMYFDKENELKFEISWDFNSCLSRMCCLSYSTRMH